MKTTKMLPISVLALGLMACLPELTGAASMGTAFTYQGRLLDADGAADGRYDFEFRLYDGADPSVATQQESTIEIGDLDVVDGYLTVALDFGSDVFTGDARWLQTAVRPGNSDDPEAFVTLSPLQKIMPVPYALQTRGLFVDDAFNVGIGTETPGAKLEITGESFDWLFRLNGSYGNLLRAHYNHNLWWRSSQTMTPTGTAMPALTIEAYSTAQTEDIFRIFDKDSNYAFVVAPSGNIGIGIADPETYKLYVNGPAAKPGGGSWANPSDIRLKRLHGNYERGLSAISRLNPVRYSYRPDNELQLPVAKRFVGLVAQEVQDVIPEAVEESRDGYLTVNNDPIIWAMLNAIKELKADKTALKDQVSDLTARLERMESMMGQVYSDSLERVTR